jgi:peptidyl-prolyl cis-trans isomerase B (cyclophilin B)
MNGMRKLMLWVGMATLAGVMMAGCAKEVEPEAPEAGPTTTNQTEEPKAPEYGPLKEMPDDGDDVAVLETDKGRIVVMFFPDRAPKHVENFKTLVSSGFYDGTRFHRCIADFMIQGGDPYSKDLKNFEVNGTPTPVGTGGNRDEMNNEVNIPLETSDLKHVRGVLSMARGGDPNSASSQFFIMQRPNSGLDGEYSAFGKVVEGLEIVDEIIVTGDAANNGAVAAKDAIMLKKASLAKWPLSGAGGGSSE